MGDTPDDEVEFDEFVAMSQGVRINIDNTLDMFLEAIKGSKSLPHTVDHFHWALILSVAESKDDPSRDIECQCDQFHHTVHVLTSQQMTPPMAVSLASHLLDNVYRIMRMTGEVYCVKDFPELGELGNSNGR